MRQIKQVTLLLVLLVQVFVLGAGSGSFETGAGPIGEARLLPEWVSTNGGPVLRVLPAHDNALGGVAHTGGRSVINNNLVDVFELEF